MAGDLTFIGVTTGSSLIMRIFPRWADSLGLDGTGIRGEDLPIHAEREEYRRVVRRLKEDTAAAGALVTTHKIDLFEACEDLFERIDHHAELCREVSCLSKRDGRFEGHAKDPISAGQSLDAFVPEHHWGDTGAEVLCLGAGGSGIAITLHLMTRRDPRDRPERIVVVNRSQGRLDAMRQIHVQIDSGVEVEYVRNADPARNDELMAALPEGSLVINATGMGKDTPGSPVTDAGTFPRRGLVWELNYRGELDFLRHARRQEGERELLVEDGWPYFIYGWTAVIEEVYDLSLDQAQLEDLAAIAGRTRDEVSDETGGKA